MKRLWFVVFAVLLAACAPTPTPTPRPVPTVTAASKLEGKHVTFGVVNNPASQGWNWKKVPVTDPGSPGFGSVNWPHAETVNLKGSTAIFALWQTPRGGASVKLDDSDGVRLYSFSFKTIEGSETELEISEYVPEVIGTETPVKKYQVHLERGDVLWIQVDTISDRLWLRRPESPQQWEATVR